MPTTKPDRPSNTFTAIPAEYRAARKRLIASSKVSAERAKQQISQGSPERNVTVSYEVVKKDGVSMLKRSEKPSANR